MKVMCISELGGLHPARWISQFNDVPDIDIYAAQSINPYVYTNPQMEKNITTTVLTPSVIQSRLAYYSPWNVSFSVSFLSKAIRKTKPDVLHSIGLGTNWKNNCLPLYLARQRDPEIKKIPWIYSIFGGDLDYVPLKVQGMLSEILKILPDVDICIPECRKDAQLAKHLGFDGIMAEQMPAHGGIKLSDAVVPVEDRHTIIVKGRDSCCGARNADPAGAASTILHAIEMLDYTGNRNIRKYSIRVVQASACIKRMVIKMRNPDLDIQCLPYISYDSLMNLMNETRIIMGCTHSDGTPSFLIEGMAHGCYPIYSNLPSIQELICDKQNGHLVAPGQTHTAYQAIIDAMIDDSYVKSAMYQNRHIVQKRFDYRTVKKRAIEIYHTAVDLYGR